MLTRRSPSRKWRTDQAALAAALIAFGVVGAVRAETPEEKGRAIAEELDRRDAGFGDSAAELKMVLSNAQGETSTRELTIETLETPEPKLGDKVLVTFHYPRDIAGTALLSFTKILEPDDQWLFLPALKRVKRISSANKSGPFVGSELAYEDMLSQEVDKFDYRWLRDDPCGNLTCFVVERYPRYENSGYTRQIMWIDQQEYRAQRVDFYDRKDALLKTLTFADYQQYLDQYWRADEWFMENHQTGKSTRLSFDDWEFRTGLDEDDLDPNRLKRLR
jgi:outer membrane lipoprotein-sorting protein